MYGLWSQGRTVVVYGVGSQGRGRYAAPGVAGSRPLRAPWGRGVAAAMRPLGSQGRRGSLRPCDPKKKTTEYARSILIPRLWRMIPNHSDHRDHAYS